MEIFCAVLHDDGTMEFFDGLGSRRIILFIIPS